MPEFFDVVLESVEDGCLAKAEQQIRNVLIFSQAEMVEALKSLPSILKRMVSHEAAVRIKEAIEVRDGRRVATVSIRPAEKVEPDRLQLRRRYDVE